VIIGVHTLIYSKDAEATRAFLRDVLGFECVDSGGGWLIFALPPAELGVHATEHAPRHELYLMCDDIAATIADLERRGVELQGPPEDQGFGIVASVRIPGADTIGIYQPKHPTALHLAVTSER
jgi:catechol 2,3-dioxygenase-like lactoylglutathione lyase family enzyme